MSPHNPPRWLLLSALLATLTLAALPCQASAPRGTLLELGPLESTAIDPLNNEFKAKMARDLGSRADDFARLGTGLVFRQMFQEHLAATVSSRKVRYGSADFHGHPREYSGRVYLPRREPGAPPTLLPLVVYQHGTETRRDFVPSNGKGDETMFGALAADGCGFAVAMPDGDGMGADPSPEMHAYCHGPSSAMCLIDLIRAALGEVGGQSLFDDENYKWDGRIYVVGYSEGGYIAMSALKELATKPEYQDINITGAACMAGPFNFAGFTRSMLDDLKTPYSRPYIPAYFLAAWSVIYPQEMSLDAAINPKLLVNEPRIPGFDTGNIKTWLNGKMGGDEITALIQARLTGKKDQAVPAREIMNEAWYQANIEKRDSTLNRLLDENSVVGGWTPRMPVLLAHDPKDETAAFQNSEAVYDAWKNQGTSPRSIVRLEANNRGTGHVGGAIVSVPMAFIWISAGMPTSPMDMATSALKESILDNTPESLLEAAEVLQTLGRSNENDALLPLSKIDCEPAKAGGAYEVSINDKLFTLGKVKFYTRSFTQMYPGQSRNRAISGYTKLLKVLKNKGDSVKLPTGEPVYMAVYPTKGAVALTLKFAGGPGAKDYTLNIKSVKNKLVLRRPPSLFTISDNFKASVRQSQFEHAKNDDSFIHLP